MWRFMALIASACGSVRACSILAMVDWRACSNSLSGNTGSRRTSAASLRAPARLGWTVLMLTLARVMEPLAPILRFQFNELILNLLASMLRGAAHQQRPGNLRRRTFSSDAVYIAKVEREGHIHRPAASFLGQQCELQSIGKSRADGARIDIGRGGIESLTGLNDRVALIILDVGCDVGGCWDLGSIGGGGRDEPARRAIGGFEIELGDRARYLPASRS